MGHVASMVQHNVVGGNNEVHHIVVGPVLRGFSDDTESLDLLTTVNLMVSFVIAFCKCCVEVMERTTSHCLKLPNVPCSKIHHITVAYRGGGFKPLQNSEDIRVLDRMSKKTRNLDFLL